MLHEMKLNKIHKKQNKFFIGSPYFYSIDLQVLLICNDILNLPDRRYYRHCRQMVLGP